MNWLVDTATTKSNHQFTVHRYVDDLFLTFDDPNHIDHVSSTFNSILQKIKYTKENEENDKLAFLDVQITKNSDCIETSIFRKNTNLGIYRTQDGTAMSRIDTNKTWSGRYCTGDIVFVIVHTYIKKNFTKFQTFSRKMNFP